MIEDSFWDHLAKVGWACTDLALPKARWMAWSQSLDDKILRPATVTSAPLSDRIRGDHLCWLDEDPSSSAREAEAWLEDFRTQLNQNLFLALKRFEAHWTIYPAGEGYDWHLDRHQHHDHRRMSFVFYLNEGWSPEDGGELEMRTEDAARMKKWPPLGGRLMVFRSEKFPHRVLPAKKTRKSLTAWFRDDAL